MGKEKNITENKEVLAPEIVEQSTKNIIVNEEVFLTPKLTEIPTVEETIFLKFGECIVEIISGPDKGKSFKTTLGTVNKYYSNESVYKILKKN